MTKRLGWERSEDPTTPLPSPPQARDTHERDEEVQRGLEEARRGARDEPGAITILVPPMRAWPGRRPWDAGIEPAK
jgi:hypothetical protein